MSTDYHSPSETVANIAREARHSAHRARNGLEFLTAAKPPLVGRTPKDLVWQRDKVTLWRYRFDAPRFHPPVLVFLGLVSQSYVLDLLPTSSFVRSLGDAGFDVYLLDWGAAEEVDAENTLETYVEFYFPRALDALARDSNCEEVTFVPYCMGAMFALLVAATQPERRIRAMVTLAAPVDFSEMGVMIGPLRDGTLDPETVIDERGLVPGEVIRRFYGARRPTADFVQYVNLWQKLWNDEDTDAHTAMAQWVRDQVPLPGAVFRQVTEMFLRENGFVNGTVRLDGRPVDLQRMTAPILSVTAEHDDIVPNECTTPLAALVASDVTDVRIPAGHVGLVMGRRAMTTTLPAITEWLATTSDELAGVSR